MITQICQSIRNWFDIERHFGTFTIKDGSIAPSDFLQDGQYYRIIGSVFNDGVHKFGSDTLTDEKPFDGAVWAMAVPPDFLLLLCALVQIASWLPPTKCKGFSLLLCALVQIAS